MFRNPAANQLRLAAYLQLFKTLGFIIYIKKVVLAGILNHQQYQILFAVGMSPLKDRVFWVSFLSCAGFLMALKKQGVIRTSYVDPSVGMILHWASRLEKQNPTHQPQPRRCYRWCRKLVETRILRMPAVARIGWAGKHPSRQGAVGAKRKSWFPENQWLVWKLLQIYFLLSIYIYLYIDIQTAQLQLRIRGAIFLDLLKTKHIPIKRTPETHLMRCLEPGKYT